MDQQARSPMEVTRPPLLQLHAQVAADELFWLVVGRTVTIRHHRRRPRVVNTPRWASPNKIAT